MRQSVRYDARVSVASHRSKSRKDQIEAEVDRYFQKAKKMLNQRTESKLYDNRDKFTKVASRRGNPGELGAAENRLLHGGKDMDCRNRCSEYNYLQMSRDARESTKKKKPNLGRYPQDISITDYPDSPFGGADTNGSEYPERISIVLTKSNKKRPPSFLFTNGDEQNHIEFEGSDDDPEGPSFSDGSDDEKQQWEKIRKQVKNDKKSKKQISRQPTTNGRSNRVDLMHEKFQPEPTGIEESASYYTDDYVAVRDTHSRKSKKPHKDPTGPLEKELVNGKKQVEVQNKPVKGRRKPMYEPSEGSEEQQSVEESSHQVSDRPPRRDVNKTQPSLNTKDTAKVDLETFNDMANNYKAKVEGLQRQVANLTNQLSASRNNSVAVRQGSSDSMQFTTAVVRHLTQAEMLMEDCLTEIDSKDDKIAKLYRCINSMDSKADGITLREQPIVKSKLEQDVNEFLQENECLIYDLKNGKTVQKDVLKDSLERSVSQREDWSPRKNLVEPAKVETVDIKVLKKNFENEILEQLDRALTGEPSESLEDALERVRQMSAELFNSRVKYSTWGEKEKSFQKQLSLSKAEFTRISDEKAKLETKLRESDAQINMLRIEQINSAAEKKSQISDTAKNIEIEAQLSKLGREIDEKNLTISKLKEQLSKQKSSENELTAVEYGPQSPKTKQKSATDPEVIQMLEYIKSMIVCGGATEAPESVELGKRLRSGAYAEQLMFLDRLIQMQASKQQALAETFRDKFLNDNILLEDIRKRLRLLVDLLAMIEASKLSDRSSDDLLSDIQDLAAKSHKTAVQLLINDVAAMKAKNDEAIRDAVAGDIDSFVHGHAANEAYESIADRSRSGDELTFANQGQSQKHSINSQMKAQMPVDKSPVLESTTDRRLSVGNRKRDQNKMRRRSTEGDEEDPNQENLMHLLVSQSKAIEKYGEN